MPRTRLFLSFKQTDIVHFILKCRMHYHVAPKGCPEILDFRPRPATRAGLLLTETIFVNCSSCQLASPGHPCFHRSRLTFSDRTTAQVQNFRAFSLYFQRSEKAAIERLTDIPIWSIPNFPA
ncbi:MULTISPECIES: hypothetical protein [unclassified Brucella]|uniref:hypothetical protein n=1 Tax=unclassified Brucella TaxID=2632610 RepID=UPI00217E33EB|nr:MULTISPECIES: hypothetical protein [unclassified Brucella]UWF66722.1 hypothetical protein NYO63_00730 [Brucella sp. 1315]UWF69846.1 hypothetical protein NYO65_00730 [Brucella sp. 2594]